MITNWLSNRLKYSCMYICNIDDQILTKLVMNESWFINLNQTNIDQIIQHQDDKLNHITFIQQNHKKNLKKNQIYVKTFYLNKIKEKQCRWIETIWIRWMNKKKKRSRKNIERERDR